MTRREEIVRQAEIFRQPYRGSGNYSTSMDIKNAFQEGAEWADKTMTERLQKLKCGYEHDLDAEPRVYEIDIQLCAKISLIEKLIKELEEE